MQLFFKILTKRFASHMNFIEILSCDINIQKEEKTVLKLSKRRKNSVEVLFLIRNGLKCSQN